MIARLVHRLGSLAYRFAFFAAACYLLWRSATESDGQIALVSLALGALCLLQFLVLAVIDYRRAGKTRPPPA